MATRRSPAPRCPACHGRILYPQRFCASCGRWLNQPAAEGPLPPPPPAERPPLPCPRCGYPAHPSASFCTNCGRQVAARPWLAPTKPRRPPKEYPWLPYVMFPLLLVIQVGLLVVLLMTSHGHLSAGRIIFVVFIAATGVANIVGAINVIRTLLKQRAGNRSDVG